MTPASCPRCGKLFPPGIGRCGIDGALLQRLECTVCRGGLTPRDRFCGHCGVDLQRQPPRRRSLDLQLAPWWRALGAWVFDGLIGYLTLSWLAALSQPITLGLALLSVPFWVAWLEVGGGASPGQEIFSLRRLDLEGHPVTTRWPWRRATGLFRV